jgi:hypothetical protein
MLEVVKGGEIAWHDQKLEEIERACEVGKDEEPAEPATGAYLKRNPRSVIRGLRRSRLGTTGQSGLSAGDYSNPAPEASIPRVIG